MSSKGRYESAHSDISRNSPQRNSSMSIRSRHRERYTVTTRTHGKSTGTMSDHKHDAQRKKPDEKSTCCVALFTRSSKCWQPIRVLGIGNRGHSGEPGEVDGEKWHSSSVLISAQAGGRLHWFTLIVITHQAVCLGFGHDFLYVLMFIILKCIL